MNLLIGDGSVKVVAGSTIFQVVLNQFLLVQVIAEQLLRIPNTNGYCNPNCDNVRQATVM